MRAMRRSRSNGLRRTVNAGIHRVQIVGFSRARGNQDDVSEARCFLGANSSAEFQPVDTRHHPMEMTSWWCSRFHASQASHPFLTSVTLCPNSIRVELSKNLPVRSSSATRISISGLWKPTHTAQSVPLPGSFLCSYYAGTSTREEETGCCVTECPREKYFGAAFSAEACS